LSTCRFYAVSVSGRTAAAAKYTYTASDLQPPSNDNASTARQLRSPAPNWHNNKPPHYSVGTDDVTRNATSGHVTPANGQYFVLDPDAVSREKLIDVSY
jgi:hypothetical protein